MKSGDLVITKQRWGMDSQHLGIILHKTDTKHDTWLVLWTTKKSCKLQEHIEEALTVLNSVNG